MLNELKSAGVIYQRVAGDTRFGLIGLGEAAVNHHELAAGLDGILTLDGLDGHVAVDDVTVLALNAELVKNHVNHFGVVAHGVVEALDLLVGILVGNEVALKGRHLALVECG